LIHIVFWPFCATLQFLVVKRLALVGTRNYILSELSSPVNGTAVSPNNKHSEIGANNFPVITGPNISPVMPGQFPPPRMMGPIPGMPFQMPGPMGMMPFPGPPGSIPGQPGMFPGGRMPPPEVLARMIPPEMMARVFPPGNFFSI
jgi:hypothetical protein